MEIILFIIIGGALAGSPACKSIIKFIVTISAIILMAIIIMAGTQ